MASFLRERCPAPPSLTLSYLSKVSMNQALIEGLSMLRHIGIESAIVLYLSAFHVAHIWRLYPKVTYMQMPYVRSCTQLRQERASTPITFKTE